MVGATRPWSQALSEEARGRPCRRCGVTLTGARAETVHCRDCVSVESAIAGAQRRGVDLGTLADDEWISPNKYAKIRKIDEAGNLIPIGVRTTIDPRRKAG